MTARCTIVVLLAAAVASCGVATAEAPAAPESSDPPPARFDHAEADTRFMQAMIVHHAQALEMTRLVPERSGRADIRLMARRIEAAQADEIALMRRWLEARGEEVPELDVRDQAEHRGHHHAEHHDHRGMAGMLSPEQMARLEAASGPEFDRLFLELMIFHHEGAIEMVRELFASPAGGQGSDIFRIASHVEADQSVEIERMRAMLEAERR